MVFALIDFTLQQIAILQENTAQQYVGEIKRKTVWALLLNLQQLFQLEHDTEKQFVREPEILVNLDIIKLCHNSQHYKASIYRSASLSTNFSHFQFLTWRK